MLSATDFLRWVRQETPVHIHEDWPAIHSNWQIIEPEAVPVDQVASYMNRKPVKVSPTTGIRELAQRMLDAHVHRVVVVDDKDRPVGIVSSTDVLREVASITTKALTEPKKLIPRAAAINAIRAH
jgi:CBS domain-containing protein